MHLNKHGTPSVSGGIMDMVLVVGSSPTMEFFCCKIFFAPRSVYCSKFHDFHVYSRGCIKAKLSFHVGLFTDYLISA